MGFFSFLGGLIGGAIEKIGEFTGIDAISDVGEAIQDVFTLTEIRRMSIRPKS